MPQSKKHLSSQTLTSISLEKVYKAIAKTLVTMVKPINRILRKLGTVVTLPRSCLPSKITSRAQWRLIWEVKKEPTKTSEKLQASLVSVKVRVRDTTIRNRLSKNGIHGRIPRQDHYWAKGTWRLASVFPENILIISKTFEKILF